MPELAELLLLGGEGADDADAVDVLVDHGGHLGQARLDDPRHREELPPHADAHDVDEGHGHHRHQRQRHADGEHEAERDDGERALDEDHRGERQVHLHGADVRVRTRDQLPRLDAVVERERHAREVLVEHVAQVELDGVRHLEEVRARDVTERTGEQPENGDQDDVVAQSPRVLDDGVGDAVLQEQRDPHLDHEAGEREDHRGEPLLLVRHDDRCGALDP